MKYQNIIAKILKMASNEFSNHGCNDFWLEPTPDNMEIIEGYTKWMQDDDPEYPDITPEDDGRYCLADYWIMRFLSEKIQETCKWTGPPVDDDPENFYSVGCGGFGTHDPSDVYCTACGRLKEMVVLDG